MTAELHNPLAWLGIFFGLIGVLIADLATVKKVRGHVPFADSAGLEQRRNTGIIIAAVGAIAFLSVFLGIESLFPLALVGVLVMLGGIVYMIRANKLGLKLEPSKDLQMVTITGVHPRFAQATQQLLLSARAQEAAQAAQAQQFLPAPPQGVLS